MSVDNDWPMSARVCRDSLAFCTEPVWSSLANVLYGCADVRNGAQGGERSASPPADVKLDPVEIKYGLYQVGQICTPVHRLLFVAE